MPQSSPRIFAVVPAAGRSRRMGSPKLLLKLGGQTVVARLLQTLSRDQRITQTILVARADDTELIAEAERLHAIVIRPNPDPPEMRDSVAIALAEIESRYHPVPEDSWALIPADHPLVRPSTLSCILDCWSQCTTDILVPTSSGRGGHPTLFRWPLAAEVAEIPSDRGLNWLFEQSPPRVLRQEFDAPELLYDLDTPADYQRAVGWIQKESDSEE